MRLWLLLTVVAAASGQDQLARIRAKVAEQTARIPNYTCLETIERRWHADEVMDNLVLDRLRLEVAVVEGKEQFSWPGGSRFDSREVKEVLGRGLTKTGDFSGFLASVFGSGSTVSAPVGEHVAAIRPAIRYDYRVPASSGYALMRNGAQAVVGFHGSFWVDPATLEFTRLEIETDNIPPALKTGSAKLAIDYGPVAVAGGTFLLPQSTDVRVVGERGLETRTITRFSGCRQFLAESSISFEERPAETAAKTKDVESAVPPGVYLDVALLTPINRKTAAAGDTVEALVRKTVKTMSGVVIPKGAMVEGRIVLLETHSSPEMNDLLLLRFTGLRSAGNQSHLLASVVRYATGRRSTFGASDWGLNDQHQILPGSPMQFWGGFLELPKGFGLRLQTEALEPH